ncbi:hypothetical protein ILYODFUR_020600 [Ilyodon furcidens]|uniref:Uncharacterized protein n=1 Tax=Ilyodon furcidens TaxID=33524 RepID=A0ABV0UU36_9TELE
MQPSSYGHLLERGTRLLLELKDPCIWIPLLETLTWKPTILRPATLSLSLPRTWNTNGHLNLKHSPPGLPLPPPPSCPHSQEPDKPFA